MSSTCPGCGEPASGRFCSSCGSALAGSVCASCSAALTPGAHFCHRCGTPAGASSAPAQGISTVLPWTVAAIALVALIALVVGQRFGARGNSAPELAAENNVPQSAPFAGSAPRAPDISKMTPGERAERLYDRIMRESEAGNVENVRTFMPMAVAAYELLVPLNLDQRYDLGRLGLVGGDSVLARAESDTILRARPTHLLGLILAAQVARLHKNERLAKELDARLVAAEPSERSAGLAEYLQHENDIVAALNAARSFRK